LNPEFTVWPLVFNCDDLWHCLETIVDHLSDPDPELPDLSQALNALMNQGIIVVSPLPKK
jgi:hypothetical protein